MSRGFQERLMRDFRGACRQVFNRAATLQHETFELADPRAGMQLDCGRRGFAFLFVRQTEVGDAGHGGMRGDGFFKLAHLDGIAAGLDDVFHAADEADEAEVIARGQVAGAEPAFGSEQGVCFVAACAIPAFVVSRRASVRRCVPLAFSLATPHLIEPFQ